GAFFIFDVQIDSGFDVDGRDVFGAEIWEQLFTDLRFANSPGLFVAIEDEQAGGANDGEGQQQKDELLPIHELTTQLTLSPHSERPFRVPLVCVVSQLRQLAEARGGAT